MRNNRTKTVVVVSTLLLLATACKKEEPVSTATPNVFSFTGTINYVGYDLEAGTNDYYMFTSYQQDANGVYNFRGELGPYSCTSCGNRLRITINDFDTTTTGGYTQIGTSLSPGFFSYAYPGGAPTAFSVQFHSGATNGAPNTFDWDFGDGSSEYALADPVHTYKRPGKYLVTFRGHYSSWTCVSSYCVNVGIPDIHCTAGFGPTNITGTIMTFYSSATGVGALTYAWDFGDGNTSTVANPVHNYANNGVYAVKLVVRDQMNHEAEFVRHCATQNWTGGYCDYYPTSTYTSNPNPQYLSNVVVEWFDANGLSWTSNSTHQSSESYFKLSSNDAYDDNSNGQTTRKLGLHFKCMLYNGTDSLSLENGNAVMAVAYH